MIYLLPWTTYEYNNTKDGHVRKAFGKIYSHPSDGSALMCRFYYQKNNPWYFSTDHKAEFNFTTAEAAMKVADEFLRSKGYYLITDEKLDRFNKKFGILI